MNYPIEDYIINFLARKESPEDVQKLKEWLAVDPPAHREELKQWLVAWDTAAMMDVAEQIDAEKAYHRFMFRVGMEKTAPKEIHTNHVFRTIQRIAAVFVISFSLGMLSYYIWTKQPPGQLAFIENMTPLGSKSEIRMSDGTTIWLNAGSTLRYPTDYGKTKRNVYLEGEGYFKVAHQDKKPFTVHTALANITDFGTEFNVKAYPEEKIVETTLIEGELAVEHGKAANEFDRIILKSGQQLLVTESDSPVIVQLDPDVAEAEVSWKERNWRIEQEALQHFAVKLERRFDVRITVDEQLKNYRFSGTLRDESLEQVLHAMQLFAPVLFTIDGNNVEIHIDPEKME